MTDAVRRLRARVALSAVLIAALVIGIAGPAPGAFAAGPTEGEESPRCERAHEDVADATQAKKKAKKKVKKAKKSGNAKKKKKAKKKLGSAKDSLAAAKEREQRYCSDDGGRPDRPDRPDRPGK